MPEVHFPNLFDDQLIVPSSSVYGIFGTLFLVLLAVSIFLLLQREHARSNGSASSLPPFAFLCAIMALSFVGLLATVGSVLTLPFLSRRIWLVLTLTALTGTIACQVVTTVRQKRPPG